MEIKLFLPDKYDLCTGDTFQLFYRGIIDVPNPYFYDILSVCQIGKNYPRYFECTPTEAGEYVLEISVFGPGKELLGKGETRLVVSNPQKPDKKTTVLCIGDSLTAGGVWVQEVYRRFCKTGGEIEGLGYDNMEFIGTCRNEDVLFEGYGGWNWENYINNEPSDNPSMWAHCENNKTVEDQHSLWQDENGAIWQIETIDVGRIKFNRFRAHTSPMPGKGAVLTHLKNAVNTASMLITNSYAETQSPFKDNKENKISITSYCQRHGFDCPDIIYVLLGINGHTAKTAPYADIAAEVANNARKFADIVHNELPSAKLKIMGCPLPSQNGGCGANYGTMMPYADKYGLGEFVLELGKAYLELANEKGYSEFVEYINISGQFDADYNLPQGDKKVNTRNKNTEVIGTNGVHPTVEGYMQIADAVFRNLVKTVGEINEL